MTSPATPAGPPKVKASPRLLVAVTLALGVVLVFLVFFSHRGLYQGYHLRQEKQQLEQENARLAAENARLARHIERLQNDPELIQDLIRRELNFVKKNEIIFQLPPEVGSTPPASSGPSRAEAAATPRPSPQAPVEAALPGHPWRHLEGAPPRKGSPPGD